MNKHIVSTRTFMALDMRYKRYKAENFPHCDEMMIPIIEKLHQSGNIVSTFGCESHWDKVDLSNPLRKDTSFYVAMVCLNKGFDLIQKFYERLLTNLPLEFTWHSELEMRKAHSPSNFDIKRNPLCFYSGYEWDEVPKEYNCVCIRQRELNSQEDKEKFHKIFNETLAEVMTVDLKKLSLTF